VSPQQLVSSYLTVSPLPHTHFGIDQLIIIQASLDQSGCGAVYFLWHCSRDHSLWALPSVLPCGARTFLPQKNSGSDDPPTPGFFIFLSYYFFYCQEISRFSSFFSGKKKLKHFLVFMPLFPITPQVIPFYSHR